METEIASEKDLLPYPLGSPRDILTALFKQKLKILIVFSVSVLAIAGWVYSKEIVYEAHASILLKFGREHIFRPEVGQVDQIVRPNSQAVESERKIIKSMDLARRVVKILGVQSIYPELLGPSGKVQGWMEEVAGSKVLGGIATTAEGGDVIKILFTHQNPRIAAKALNVLLEALKEKHLQVFSDPKASFLKGQLNDYKTELEKAEESLQAFKQKYDLSSPLEDQQGRFLDQRSHLDTNIKSNNNKLEGLRGKVVSLESQMRTIPEHIPLSTTEAGGMLAKAKDDLFTLRRTKQGLLAKYTENSLPVQNIEKEIELVKEFIETQKNAERNKSVTSGKNPIYQGLEVGRLAALSEIKTLLASNDVIVEQVRELDEKIQRLDILREELVKLQREKETAEENYQLYVKKVEEAKVSEEMDQLKMSNISIIQKAEIPTTPAGKPKSRLMLFGTVFSALLSLGVAFIVEYLGQAYTRPDQAAEDLGLPVLASFNHKG